MSRNRVEVDTLFEVLFNVEWFICSAGKIAPTDHCVGPIRRYIVSSGRLVIWIGKYIYKRRRHPPPQSPSSLPKCYLFIIIFIIENKFLCGSNSTMVLRMCEEEEEDDLEYVEAAGDWGTCDRGILPGVGWIFWFIGEWKGILKYICWPPGACTDYNKYQSHPFWLSSRIEQLLLGHGPSNATLRKL